MIIFGNRMLYIVSIIMFSSRIQDYVTASILQMSQQIYDFYHLREAIL